MQNPFKTTLAGILSTFEKTLADLERHVAVKDAEADKHDAEIERRNLLKDEATNEAARAAAIVVNLRKMLAVR